MAKATNPLIDHSLFEKTKKTLSYSKIKNVAEKETYVVRSKKLKVKK
jgi:hypothetical protein